MNIDLAVELELAISLAKHAKKHLLKFTKDEKVIEADQGRDIKLQADFESDRYILEFLTENSPHPILLEESGKTNFKSDSEYFWAIDPLDGSMNFLRGIPMCCISIALFKGRDPILGVIVDLFRDEIFYGSSEGSYLNGKKIKVSRVDRKNKAIIATGFPIATDFSDKALRDFLLKVKEYKKMRMIGSAALSLAYVASSRFDIYMENGIRLWDVGAGLALVKFAGGKISFKEINNDSTFKVVASNNCLEEI